MTKEFSPERTSEKLRFASGPNEAISVAVGSERSRNTAEQAAVHGDEHVVSDTVMGLCRQMVADGFVPGCPEELDSVAADADMVMTHSDGKTFEACLILDATERPRAIAFAKEELLRAGARAGKYIGTVWAVTPRVRLSVWCVGSSEPTDAELQTAQELATGRRGEGGVTITVWHLSTDGRVRSSAGYGGLWDDGRSMQHWIARSNIAPEYEPLVSPSQRLGWLPFAILMVAMFALQQFVHQGPRNGFLGLNAPLARALGGADSSVFGEWYRLVTATFVHENLGHLLGNLVALVLCGQVCGRFVGRANTAAVFLLGGAAGAVLSAAGSPEEVVSIGASGGIAALWSLGLLSTLRQPHRRARMAATGRLRLVGLFAILTTVTGGISAALAHLGGLLAGLAWGSLASTRWVPRSQSAYERLAVGIVAVAAALGIHGVDQLRASFHNDTAGLFALEFLMADSDVERLRSASLATADEAATEFPYDPRVHYVHAHKLLDQDEFAASLEASALAIEAVQRTEVFFSSGSLEGSIRQLRILAAEAGSVPDVITYESRVLCGRLLATDAGEWALNTGFCAAH